MARKPHDIILSEDERAQALEHTKAVELIPALKVSTSAASYITVRIANCSMRVTDNTDLRLLRKISKAFDYD